MMRLAWWTIALSVVGAACSVGLALATSAAWSSGQPSNAQLAFVAGPLLFLSLLVWRRRRHAARSRLLFVLTLLEVVGGLGVLGCDYIRFRNEPPEQHAKHSHPLIVPLIQWAAAVVAWLILVFQERQEKQSTNKNA